MRHFLALALVAAVLALPAIADERPLAGDLTHGQKLLKAAGVDSPRVDGGWLNAFSDEQALARLGRGGDGFPEIDSENPLDLWDALAVLRGANTDLRDLLMGANHVYVAPGKLDENAMGRLKDQAKLDADAIGKGRRVFGLYKLEGHKGLTYVSEKDNKKHDQLKKKTKVGYVVFVPLPGLREGGYEAAFAVDTNIRIQSVVIRAPDGTAPTDLNQAAQRFLGKGARGQYAALKPSGAGKAVGELTDPLSAAFLVGMESVYMFEVAERDYFAFDD